MSMTKQTWSISGLSVELGVDRRTLGKRLADLPPAESRKVGNRTERRWFLSDVLCHLADLRKPIRRNSDDIVEQRIALFNETIAEHLFPAVVSSRYFYGLTFSYGKQELGFTDDQCQEVFSMSVLALSFALAEVMQAPDIKFVIPPYAEDILRKCGDRSRASESTKAG